MAGLDQGADMGTWHTAPCNPRAEAAGACTAATHHSSHVHPTLDRIWMDRLRLFVGD
jgi:hypothetical protein